MKRLKYFNRDGAEIDSSRALDRQGVLRDGFSMRVPMAFADAARRDAVPVDATFTDGRNPFDPDAGGRPGFRIPVVNDRAATRDSYERYETQACNRWRCNDGEDVCGDCDGSGEDENGAECRSPTNAPHWMRKLAANGEGVVDNKRGNKKKSVENFGSGNETHNDGRTIDHQTRMQQEYAAHDAELSNMWRTGR